MIFLTVGTHEQQFDRLVKAVDLLEEETFIQYGFSLPPESAKGEKFLEYAEVQELTQKADTIIVQGGAGSILTALHYGRVPVAVPRYFEFGEHVDNHQVEIVEKLSAAGLVIPMYKNDDIINCIYLAKKREAENVNDNEKTASMLVELLDDFISKL